MDRIEALAKVMYVADWHAQRPEYTLERVGSWWEKETQLCRDQYGVVAEAALRFLAFVDSAGEVYCPSEGAVARLKEALRKADVLAEAGKEQCVYCCGVWTHTTLALAGLDDLVKEADGE